MITLRSGSHAHRLLLVLAVTGEYPMRSLHLLGSSRTLEDIDRHLTALLWCAVRVADEPDEQERKEKGRQELQGGILVVQNDKVWSSYTQQFSVDVRHDGGEPSPDCVRGRCRRRGLNKHHNHVAHNCCRLKPSLHLQRDLAPLVLFFQVFGHSLTSFSFILPAKSRPKATAYRFGAALAPTQFWTIQA